MTPEEFVKEFSQLKSYIESNYFSDSSDISRVKELTDAGLNDQQVEVVKELLSDALTDSLYTVLLGLDGCASIGSQQISYNLKDEDGNQISGDIESLAWEEFHG